MRAHIPIVLLFCALFFPPAAKAFHIQVHGVVTGHFSGKPEKGVEILLVKDNIDRESVHTDRRGRYELFIDRGYAYELHFRGEGMVTKILSIDAREIPLFPDAPFFEMEVMVSMIPAVDEYDLSAYEKPVGHAEYKHSVRNLNWETELTKARRTELQRLMIDYQRELIARQKIAQREAEKAGKKRRGTVWF